MVQKECPVAAFRELMATFRVSANCAWNLLEEGRNGAAADLAGLLAYLQSQPAYAGDDPTTKLDILRASLIESITAGRAAAQLLGIDLAQSEPESGRRVA